MRLAEQLKYYREKNNETQESLALKLNVTRQSISKWETGACFPDIKILVKLSDLYQVSLDELIKGRRFFTLPFSVGIPLTRKKLFRHFILFILISIFISSIFASAISESTPYSYLSLLFLLLMSFIAFYVFFFLPFNQRFNSWQIQKEGLLVYDSSYSNQLRSFYLILFKGSNLSLYQLLPYHSINYAHIEFKKKIMNPKEDYSTFLVSGPSPVLGRTLAEPFYMEVKTHSTKYFLDLGNDYTRCSGNAYFFLPEIKEWFDLKGVELKDPQQFVEHAKKGVLVYDFVYAKEEQRVRELAKKRQ